MDTEQTEAFITLLNERLLELELALENQSWARLTWEAEQEFSRAGLRKIAELARLMYIKNPLIGRGVNVQADYVFAQGVTIRSDNEATNTAIQQFMDDERNKVEMFGHPALLRKERTLQTKGNLFLTLFTDRLSGRVVIRSLPVDEVEEIISDPDDRQTPWYYLRVWNEKRFDLVSGAIAIVARETYYPDWRYSPRVKPQTIGGHPVNWNAPVYHVSAGGLDDMTWGIPEVYSSLDWGKAYKDFLEDWATITRAYSRFAFNLTTKGGARGVAAAKSTLGTTYGNSGSSLDTNPPPVTGATFISSEGVKLDPIRTSGATTKMEDGRRLLLMVAAGQGLPETFYGDVSVGTLATATSLDRPTELKFLSRQQLWKDVFQTLCRYALAAAIQAPRNALRGTVRVEDDGTPQIMVYGDDGEMVPPNVIVEFPPLIEHSTPERVGAIMQASAKLPDERLIASMLLNALGQSDTDDLLNRMYPPDKSDDAQNDLQDDTEQDMVEAVRELRQAVQRVIQRGS